MSDIVRYLLYRTSILLRQIRWEGRCSEVFRDIEEAVRDDEIRSLTTKSSLLEMP